MSEQNNAIVQQAYTNFKMGDIEALLNLMSDDITWTLPEMEGVPFAGKRSGRASVAEFFATVNSSQEPLQFEPRELIRRRRQSRRAWKLPVARQGQRPEI